MIHYNLQVWGPGAEPLVGCRGEAPPGMQGAEPLDQEINHLSLRLKLDDEGGRAT